VKKKEEEPKGTPAGREEKGGREEDKLFPLRGKAVRKNREKEGGNFGDAKGKNAFGRGKEGGKVLCSITECLPYNDLSVKKKVREINQKRCSKRERGKRKGGDSTSIRRGKIILARRRRKEKRKRGRGPETWEYENKKCLRGGGGERED